MADITYAVGPERVLKKLRDMGDGSYAEIVAIGAGSGGGAATIADGADATQGAKADAKSAAVDTTAVSVMQVLKQLSFSLQTAVRGINVAGATLTRAANATPYSINDSVSDNATPGSVTALTTNNLSDVNDDLIELTEVLLDSTDTGPGTAGATIRCHVFNSDPTASTGVVGGDNLAWSNKRAGWLGSFSGTMRLFSDGSKGVLVPDEGSLRIANPATGAKNLWYQLQTLTAFTPSANSTTFTPRFKGFQGRT